MCCVLSPPSTRTNSITDKRMQKHEYEPLFAANCKRHHLPVYYPTLSLSLYRSGSTFNLLFEQELLLNKGSLSPATIHSYVKTMHRAFAVKRLVEKPLVPEPYGMLCWIAEENKKQKCNKNPSVRECLIHPNNKKTLKTKIFTVCILTMKKK